MSSFAVQYAEKSELARGVRPPKIKARMANRARTASAIETAGVQKDDRTIVHTHSTLRGGPRRDHNGPPIVAKEFAARGQYQIIISGVLVDAYRDPV